jgi:H+/Cl- antiporter ClcA/CBS domain-containing protein
MSEVVRASIPPSVPERAPLVDRRVLVVAGLSLLLGLAAAAVAQVLQMLIACITHLAFFGELAAGPVSPADNHLGAIVVLVPIVGGLVVGLMARFGSPAIRGHGIPEAMEQILVNESRIPRRMMFLKPLSAAIAIGTGGPFGAEGPIIATGGAMGSVLGQYLRVTADERKTLLAAGAAAGMSATFGSPVSAVLLAIELLLFEYRARSVIPVALAACSACAMRIAWVGDDPVFALEHVTPPTAEALAFYVVLGAISGLAAVAITRALYALEDRFERLPVSWTWWPALGGVAVGVVGWLVPRTLGVGYDNIERVLAGDATLGFLAVLCVAKLVSWLVSLASGTSGGTLAPLFTIGGAHGAFLATLVAGLAPSWGIDPRIGALVGMASLFAGASRALLASAIFAFETTQQPMGLLPLLGGCSAAYFVSCAAMRNSIMTEKLARRGLPVTSEYAVDHLDRVKVEEHMTADVITMRASDTVESMQRWLAEHRTTRHTGFPVVDEQGRLIGVVTRRDLETTSQAPEASLERLVARPPIVVHPQHTLRQAADHMIVSGVGRVVVVRAEAPREVIGILTRSDLLAGHTRRLAATRDRQPARALPGLARAHDT